MTGKPIKSLSDSKEVDKVNLIFWFSISCLFNRFIHTENFLIKPKTSFSSFTFTAIIFPLHQSLPRHSSMKRNCIKKLLKEKCLGKYFNFFRWKYSEKNIIQKNKKEMPFFHSHNYWVGRISIYFLKWFSFKTPMR